MSATSPDSIRGPILTITFSSIVSCAGEIVLQSKLRPLALRFEDSERKHWLRVAVDALRDGSDTDVDPAT